MIIEKLKKEDLVGYKNLIDDCFASSNDISEYINNYNDSSPSYEILVAKESDKIIGSVTLYKIDLFTFSFHPSLEIFNVGVAKEFRGMKVAKKLFEYVIEYAKENSYKSIVLNVIDGNYDAINLYESVGFKRTDSIKYKLLLSDL